MHFEGVHGHLLSIIWDSHSQAGSLEIAVECSPSLWDDCRMAASESAHFRINVCRIRTMTSVGASATIVKNSHIETRTGRWLRLSTAEDRKSRTLSIEASRRQGGTQCSEVFVIPNSLRTIGTVARKCCAITWAVARDPFE